MFEINENKDNFAWPLSIPLSGKSTELFFGNPFTPSLQPPIFPNSQPPVHVVPISKALAFTKVPCLANDLDLVNDRDA